MKFRTKRSIVMAGLVVLAMWPLLHVVVVRSTGISPWRGFGWGMYTVPVMNVDVRVRRLEGEAGGNTEEGQAAMVQEIKQYIKRYQALGNNAKPDAVAASVFAAYPGFQRIEVNVEQHALDRRTARIVEDRSDPFRYGREGGLEPADE